jgi:RHS repeat-associated protein
MPSREQVSFVNPFGLSDRCHLYREVAVDPEVGSWISSDPLELEGGLNLYGFDGAPTDVVDPLGLATKGGGCSRRGTVRNISVRHPTRKRAKEAAAHAHHGKPRPTPKKADKKKRESYDEAQKYKSPEAHRDSEKHPESHFHDSNKSKQQSQKKLNRHHDYPE